MNIMTWRYRKAGKHVHVHVYINGELAGILTFRAEEFESIYEYRAALTIDCIEDGAAESNPRDFYI